MTSLDRFFLAQTSRHLRLIVAKMLADRDRGHVAHIVPGPIYAEQLLSAESRRLSLLTAFVSYHLGPKGDDLQAADFIRLGGRPRMCDLISSKASVPTLEAALSTRWCIPSREDVRTMLEGDMVDLIGALLGHEFGLSKIRSEELLDSLSSVILPPGATSLRMKELMMFWSCLLNPVIII
jgi:hypothetical protein